MINRTTMMKPSALALLVAALAATPALAEKGPDCGMKGPGFQAPVMPPMPMAQLPGMNPMAGPQMPMHQPQMPQMSMPMPVMNGPAMNGPSMNGLTMNGQGQNQQAQQMSVSMARYAEQIRQQMQARQKALIAQMAAQQAQIEATMNKLAASAIQPRVAQPFMSAPRFQMPQPVGPGFNGPGFMNQGFMNPGFNGPGLMNPGFMGPGFRGPNFGMMPFRPMGGGFNPFAGRTMMQPGPMIQPPFCGESAKADATVPAPVVSAAPTAKAAADSDQDGVMDTADFCPDTASGMKVDGFGCAQDAIITLEGVNFRTDSDQLTDSSLDILNRVAATLVANPAVVVEITGHTDSQGDAAYNLDLSDRRAKSVMAYLGKQGVAAANMTARGLGETVPVADNASAEGRAKNRRVELRRMDSASAATSPAVTTPAATTPAIDTPAEPAAEATPAKVEAASTAPVVSEVKQGAEQAVEAVAAEVQEAGEAAVNKVEDTAQEVVKPTREASEEATIDAVEATVEMTKPEGDTMGQ